MPEQAELRELIAEVENLSVEVVQKEHKTNLENAAHQWKGPEECSVLLAFWRKVEEDGSFESLPDSAQCCLAGWPEKLEIKVVELLSTPVSESAVDFPALQCVLILEEHATDRPSQRQRHSRSQNRTSSSPQ